MPRDKNWKELLTRAAKLHRAKQLGFSYPRESECKIMERESLHVLFVCSMNQWRSPTAEKIYSDRPLISARSRGTSTSARRTVSAKDLKWADIIFVMEDKHHARLKSDFPGDLRFKALYVLDIPDNYRFMDDDLIAEIHAGVDPILERHQS